MFRLVMKHIVECLILLLKHNDFKDLRMQKLAAFLLISKHSLNINFLSGFVVIRSVIDQCVA